MRRRMRSKKPASYEEATTPLFVQLLAKRSLEISVRFIRPVRTFFNFCGLIRIVGKVRGLLSVSSDVILNNCKKFNYC